MNLLRLGRITANENLAGEGERLLRSFMGSVGKQPAAYLFFLDALDYLSAPLTEITLAGRREAPETAAMLHEISRRFIPGLVLRFEPAGDAATIATGSATTARLCAAGACHPTVSGARNLEMLLDEILTSQPGNHPHG
jgi:hypothetical protein